MAVTLGNRIMFYVNLSKPRIIWLLDLAALGGYFLAFRYAINLLALAVVLIGGTLASGGAMIINGGWEIDKDSKMRRTSKRPTVLGYVNKNQAITVGALLVALGTGIGLLANPLTAFFIFLGAFIYVFVYTIWLKPRHPANIVIGGFAGSAAAWAGYAALSGKFDLASFILGFLIFMWTPGHFWSLALRFKDDYARAGVPMLPVITDERKAAIAIAISNAAMIPVAILLYFYTNLIYLGFTLLFSAILMTFSIKLIKNPTAEEAWTSFKVSAPYLAIILIALIVSKIV
ncbi:heme o synthase [Sulfuracidifex metallicus]|uniref:heme o synthase n=1 Tax=Sulfuracidifex metallicus TaxID=47303 RepID=UPI002272CFA1|nr:heme o synthase [Sulfuracidifex metallicus]MCY0849886.1 heme o synthase [Sulfuracidifex metallicus]